MNEAKDNFSDCCEKTLFSSVSTDKLFETPYQRHCKAKKGKEEVNQAPEKPNKELEIMKYISKSLQSTLSSDDLFGMMVAAEIKTLSPKKTRKIIRLEINSFLFKYQEDNDAPPPMQMYGNTNTNLRSILLNEPWPYDSLR